ncbi:MAG: iron dependent repressor, metal binding and dimerization domain protein [Syntrophomonas sp.]
MEQEFYTVRGYEILNKRKKGLSPSMEDYLEMIYKCCLNEGYTRISNLAELLNVKASSASKIVKKLSDADYINYEKYSIIRLTDKGRNIGEFLMKRHKTLETFLKSLGVIDNLLLDTELIEHHLSMETLNIIEIFNAFCADNPDIIERLHEYQTSHS